MILSELRDYIRDRRRVTLIDMALRFDRDPDAVRDMVSRWVAKGKVARVEGTRCGKTCCGCAPPAQEIYEWRG